MKEGKNRVLAEVWGWVWRLALAVVIAQAVHLMVFQPVSVKGESMTDTLQNGEIMYVSKPEYLLGDPERFDVVICHYPGREENFVKRVIGLPGDVITVRDKRLYRNGMPVEESYVRYEQPNIIEPVRDNFGPVTVPPDKYFVMGDNRDNSLDSRFWGFVDRGAIQAKAWRIYWSWDDKDNSPRWSRIGKAVR